jgi:hypothetical protein
MAPVGRAAELIATLQLAPHPEGGWYREIFRGAGEVQPAGGGAARNTLTSIDFLLQAGQCSAWHRVAADEAWHLLEGGPLRLWLLPPDLGRVEFVDLAPVDGQGRRPRHVVPANWWQAAEPLPGADFAYVGATVGPGFDFADFSFGRDDAAMCSALRHLAPDVLRLL